jgi:hypothetical protein
VLCCYVLQAAVVFLFWVFDSEDSMCSIRCFMLELHSQTRQLSFVVFSMLL